MSVLRSIVRGVGGHLPARVVSNDELSRRIDTSDEWIQQRVGIKQRYIAADGEVICKRALALVERGDCLFQMAVERQPLA